MVSWCWVEGVREGKVEMEMEKEEKTKEREAYTRGDGHKYEVFRCVL
jgi:hypothetical protein